MKGLDTNVLVRALVQDDKIQGPTAGAYMQRQCTRETPCFVNRVVLCELVWVLESFYEYPRAEIADIMDRILRTEELLVEDDEAVRYALSAYRVGRADFADAMIGRCNRSQGCAATATFDRKAATLPEFESVDKVDKG